LVKNLLEFFEEVAERVGAEYLKERFVRAE
jgi:hypothetical protein